MFVLVEQKAGLVLNFELTYKPCCLTDQQTGIAKFKTMHSHYTPTNITNKLLNTGILQYVQGSRRHSHPSNKLLQHNYNTQKY